MKLILLFVLSTIALASFAQDRNESSSTHLNLDRNIAIQGYDPVSYFSENRAKKGSSDFQYTYQSATYYFSSEKNLGIFKSNPEKYEPQYGGWCAYAIGENGEKVSINPKTFKIKDGKLYLFYNAFFTNTLTLWNERENELQHNADKNWQNIISQ